MVDDELVGGYVYAVTVEADLANQIECTRYVISIRKTIDALRFASTVAVRSIENYLKWRVRYTRAELVLHRPVWDQGLRVALRCKEAYVIPGYALSRLDCRENELNEIDTISKE